MSAQKWSVFCFNTQPPEGGCAGVNVIDYRGIVFQHTAAQRRLPSKVAVKIPSLVSFNTQPRRGGCHDIAGKEDFPYVSTHSRAEAAAGCLWMDFTQFNRFNTQPRRGGCMRP